MLFHSLDYWLFLLFTLIIYWRLPHKAQNLFLLTMSYLFYAYWSWRFLSLLIFSTLVDYLAALWIQKTAHPRYRRLLLLASVLINLGLLFTFKYYNFFIEAFAKAFFVEDQSFEYFLLQVGLPLGISFYTFQSMSYTIDCYRGKMTADKSLINVSLYVSFFPQLIAGPIERAKFLLGQIQRPRVFQWGLIKDGFMIFLWGLFKKVCIGDVLGPPIDSYYAQEKSPSIYYTLLIGLVMTFKVYYDFSGYSDMARGAARMFGVEISLNFKPFYFARHTREFWERWHITMTKWVRDYVILPLIRNQSVLNNTTCQLIGLLIIGVWHGPTLNWLIFGFYCWAIIQFQDRWIRPLRWGGGINRVFTLLFLSLGGLLHFTFTAQRMDHVLSTFTETKFYSDEIMPLAKYFFFTVFPAVALECYMEFRKDYDAFLELHWLWKGVLIGAALAMIFALGHSELQDFIYFQF